MSDVEFSDKCPQCGGKMAKGNRFCCLACYCASEDITKEQYYNISRNKAAMRGES